MTKKETKWLYLAVIASPLFFIGTALGLQLDKPTANLTEKWTTNSAGWNVSGSLSGWTNGAMKIGFPVQVDDVGASYSLSGSTNASSGAFFGNYQNKSIDALSFRASAVNLTMTPVLYFNAASGRTWQKTLSSNFGSTWTTNLIPLVYSSGWTISPPWTNEVYFSRDLTNIVEVGFRLTRGPNGSTNAQSFTVDNMKLVGPWGGPFTTNGVSLAWVVENGLTNDLASIDSDDNDHDGFSNAAEYLAGTDPNNSNSFFKIEIVRNDNGQMVVRWTGNRYVKYDLLEASSLGGTNPFTPKMTNIAAVAAQEVVVGDDGVGPKFYKVQIKGQ